MKVEISKGCLFILVVFLSAAFSPTMCQETIEEKLDRLEAEVDSFNMLIGGLIASEYCMTVHFIDVGHGDCIFIETPDDNVDNDRYEGYRVLIDAGDKGRGKDCVIPYLGSLGMAAEDTIDYVIVTHAHQDHIGGLPAIYDTFQVNATLDPGYIRIGSDGVPDTGQPTKLQGRLNSRLKNEQNSQVYWGLENTPFERENGYFIDLGDELTAEILHFDSDVHKDSINNSSIVLRIQYQDISFLFTGDAMAKDRDSSASHCHYTEDYLVTSYGNALQSTVLKVGHHGSKTSSSIPFIQAVQPRLAIICAGRKSHSGTILPDESVIERYEEAGAKVWRTDEDDEGKASSEAHNDDHFVIRTNGRVFWQRIKERYSVDR